MTLLLLALESLQNVSLAEVAADLDIQQEESSAASVGDSTLLESTTNAAAGQDLPKKQTSKASKRTTESMQKEYEGDGEDDHSRLSRDPDVVKKISHKRGSSEAVVVNPATICKRVRRA
ncbi:hypothetical protein B0H11DRAFT_2242594 [Mycena galericulata]|nr:hypothetical protein B0H11DRAFT_2242594 [Mycena galericulata]